VAHCFEVAADPNPFLKVERQVAQRLEHQIKGNEARSRPGVLLEANDQRPLRSPTQRR
jgi:hypothetical protein